MTKDKPNKMFAANSVLAEMLGGDILDITIEKWELVGKPANWRTLKETPLKYLGRDTCPLCIQHNPDAEETCGECPLIDDDETHRGCGPGSFYSIAMQGVVEDDRDAFMAGRKNILKKLKRIQASRLLSVEREEQI